MMHRLARSITIALVLLLVATGCGGDDGGGGRAAVDSATDCQELAAAFLVVFQERLDRYGDATVAEAQSDEAAILGPGQIATETRLDARVDELGCTEADLSGYLCERQGELLASGEAATFIRRQLLDQAC